MARVRLDREGVGEMLRSNEVARAVHGAAGNVEAAARAQGHIADDVDIKGTAAPVPLPIEVSQYTTDRAAAAVTITHPAGLGMQAKHGVLTRAASAAGLEVNDG